MIKIEKFLINKVLPTVFFVLFFSTAAGYGANALDAIVMPKDYAIAVANYTGTDPETFQMPKWRTIRLWGRCPSNLANDYQYCWLFGDEPENARKTWIDIEDFDEENPFNSSCRYLVSSEHTYQFNGTKPFRQYEAKLLIKRRNANNYDTFPLTVSVADLSKITTANGYGDAAHVAIAKRDVVEKIAVGRGLTYIYLTQKSDGHWDPVVLDGQMGAYSWQKIIPTVKTGLSLLALLNFSQNDSGGIFLECIDSGLNYIFSKSTYDNVRGVKLTKNTGDVPVYEHGINMLVLASYNRYVTNGHIKMDKSYSVGGVNRTFKQIVQGAVQWAEYAQFKKNSYTNNYNRAYEGGWRYVPPQDDQNVSQKINNAQSCENENYYIADLSAGQWPVLGLAAIEREYRITADNNTKQRIANNYLLRTQWQGSSQPTYYDESSDLVTVPNTQNGYRLNPDGGAFYSGLYFNETNPTLARAYNNYNYNNTNDTNNLKYGKSPQFIHGINAEWLVGTNSFIQFCFYLSLDITNNVTACQCGASNCNRTDTDYMYNNAAPMESCFRVKHAVDFIGRLFPIPEHATGTTMGPYNEAVSLYTMYGIMKALRVYKIEQIPDANGNYFRWEDRFSDYLLYKQSAVNGSWNINDSWQDGGTYIYINGGFAAATQWAILIFGNVFIEPEKTLKTENKNMGTKIQQQAFCK